MFYEVLFHLSLLGILFSLLFAEKKIKEKQKYYNWIAEERFRIKSLSEAFMYEGMKDIEKYTKTHNDRLVGSAACSLMRLNISNYYSSHSELCSKLRSKREWYESNFSSLYKKKYGSFNEATYPRFLVNEYIDEITNIYHQLDFTVKILYSQIECAEDKVNSY